MSWQVKGVSAPLVLPARVQRIGSVTVRWEEINPGVAYVTTYGGTPDDRWLTYAMVRDSLATFGIRNAQFSIDPPVANATTRISQAEIPDDEGYQRNRPVKNINGFSFFEVPDNRETNPQLGSAGYERRIFDGSRTPIVYKPEFSHFFVGDSGDFHDAIHQHPWGLDDSGSPIHFPDEGQHGYYLNHGNEKGEFGLFNAHTLEPEAAQALREYMVHHDRHNSFAGYEPTEDMLPYQDAWLDAQEEMPDSEDLWSSSVRKTAAWPDIMAKAKRLVQSGNVTLLRNGYNIVVAHVIGDHGEYTCEISRDDPESRAITQWTCECPWDQFAFQRTRQWKKYEGRPCAHVLAAYWKSLATPLDEDVAPGQEGRPGQPVAPGTPRTFSPSPITTPQHGIMDPQQGIEQGYQPSLPMQGNPGGEAVPMPGMDQTFEGPSMGPLMPGMGMPPTSQMPMTVPPSLSPPLMAPPGETGIIPPQPMAMDPNQMQLPVSVPGGRPGPYPANPIQQPGTFSKVAQDNVHYHESSPRNRESIAHHGLLVSKSQEMLEKMKESNPPIGQGTQFNEETTPPGVYLTKQPMNNCSTDIWQVDTKGLNPLYDPWSDALPVYKTNPYLAEFGGSSYLPHDVPPNRIKLVRPASPNGCANPECEDCGGALATLAAVYKFAGANDTFAQGMRARLNEATLGQAEGREGATDAGQWMEVPKNSMVEVRDQDDTTGWVEIIYPLKGGPMTSYHVRCFVEPEKLSPMQGASPFQPNAR